VVVAHREQLKEPGAEALTDQLGEPLVGQLDLGIEQVR
jgi:hypothetical protein